MFKRMLLIVATLAVSACATAAGRTALNCPKPKPGFDGGAVRHPYHLDAATADDAGFDTQWALARIGAPAAWTRTKGDRSTIVGVIDSGLDLTHPDLMGQVWTHQPIASAPLGSVDQQARDNGMYVLYGANYFTGPERHPCDFFRGPRIAFPCDAEGHGTSVASIIASQAGNSIGIAGVAWNATILPVKFIDEDTDDCVGRACFPQRAAEAIRYAASQGANILNLSWGGGEDDPDLRATLRNLENANVLVVAAAGNDQTDLGCEPHYPASYEFKNILVVGASDSDDKLCEISNFGAKVDLYAPGCGVKAADLHGGYGSKDGTSIAAPHAAGAAVLLMHLAPKWSALDIKAYLIESADHPKSLHRKSAKPLARLNVDRATSAPVELDGNVENTTWEQGDLHQVSWTRRFQSTVCPAGELWLDSEDRSIHQRIGDDLHDWYKSPSGTADVIAAPTNPSGGPWRVRLVAKCPGTSVKSTSPPFTLL